MYKKMNKNHYENKDFNQENDIVINVKNLFKNYSNNKGVFDFSIEVKRGKIFGLLGPNGAGKTTTIRHILGFQKPVKGEILVNGINP
jgi:ABC-2 type transport system ATP-binding protein